MVSTGKNGTSSFGYLPHVCSSYLAYFLHPPVPFTPTCQPLAMSSRLLVEACHDPQPSPYLYGEGGLVCIKNTFVHLQAMEMEKGLRRCSSSPTMCSERQAASFFNGDCLNRNSDHVSKGKLHSDSSTMSSAEDGEDSPSSQGSGPLLFPTASLPESECKDLEEFGIQELDQQIEATWNQEENDDPALVAERRAEQKAREPDSSRGNGRGCSNLGNHGLD